MSPPPALPFRHIAVEGPIGVGKTSLDELLAKQFRGTKILEDADNPFLDEFYKDKRGAAFRTELFFLLSRYDQQRQLAQRDLFTRADPRRLHASPRARSSRTSRSTTRS